MPLNKYFKGDGEKVMSSMKSRYGGKKGESVFYATANKRGLAPSDKVKHGMMRNKKRIQYMKSK